MRAPRAGAYAALASFALALGIVFSHPALIVASGPFILALIVGAVTARSSPVSGRITLESDRMTEGETLSVAVDLSAAAGTGKFDVFLHLPDGVALDQGTNPVIVTFDSPMSGHAEFSLRTLGFGAHRIGPAVIRRRQLFGVVENEFPLQAVPLVVYPRPLAVKLTPRTSSTQLFSGNEVSRSRGDGLEFADMRPFETGDRLRQINWKATARQRSLWVNEHHPERNIDVVLIVDSLENGPGEEAGATVRAAVGLAEAYLRHRDRVGLLTVGSGIRWLRPGSGRRQLQRVVDALLDPELSLSTSFRPGEMLPLRLLPPNALLVALTTFTDETIARLLVAARARAFDVLAIEVSLADTAAATRASDLRRLASDLAALQHQALRSRLRRAGVHLAVWRNEEPLTRPIEEIRVAAR